MVLSNLPKIQYKSNKIDAVFRSIPEKETLEKCHINSIQKMYKEEKLFRKKGFLNSWLQCSKISQLETFKLPEVLVLLLIPKANKINNTYIHTVSFC